MNNPLFQEIKKLLDRAYSADVAEKFRNKLRAGRLTRDEDPEKHLCAYFAACDFKNKQLFIGQHIKSGLWLFNGGHIDQGETLRAAVAREIEEEWGMSIDDLNISAPALLTTADINNPTKQACRLHLDIWHFINVDKDNFHPDPARLAQEVNTVEWIDLGQARELVTDPGTLRAIDFIEANYF